jgi:hypothetical protein
VEELMETGKTRIDGKRLVRRIVTAVAALLAAVISAGVLLLLSFGRDPERPVFPSPKPVDVKAYYDAFIQGSVDTALLDVEPIRWIYELSDEDLIAPEPNPACFGTTKNPSELQWLLDAAKETLGVEDTVFSTETKILSGSKVTYYLDDSILVITWKEVRRWAVYTVSEVKVAHASQFRRYVSDGVYGSETLLPPTSMAATVNAVTACNGDFYMQRSWGVNVYMGQVRNLTKVVDTCFITDTGDLLFAKAGAFDTVEAAQKFVDDNGVRFSLAFGPVLVEDGKNVTPASYPLGEIKGHYARSALCQQGELHYLLVTVNSENGHSSMPTSWEFARELEGMGIDKAFSLDGGQSAAIVTNDRLINRPVYGSQRYMSDIIYFATAIPEDRWQKEP